MHIQILLADSFVSRQTSPASLLQQHHACFPSASSSASVSLAIPPETVNTQMQKSPCFARLSLTSNRKITSTRFLFCDPQFAPAFLEKTILDNVALKLFADSVTDALCNFPKRLLETGPMNKSCKIKHSLSHPLRMAASVGALALLLMVLTGCQQVQPGETNRKISTAWPLFDTDKSEGQTPEGGKWKKRRAMPSAG
jgi:hypothetical protein